MNSKQTVVLSGPVEISDANGNVIGVATDVELTTETELEEFSINPHKTHIVPTTHKTTMKVRKWKTPLSSYAPAVPADKVLCEYDGFKLVAQSEPWKDQHRIVLYCEGRFAMNVTDEFLANATNPEEYIQAEFLGIVAKTLEILFEGFSQNEFKPAASFGDISDFSGTGSKVMAGLQALFAGVSKKGYLCPEPTCKARMKQTIYAHDKVTIIGEREVAFAANVWYMVQHLNDAHKWPREEIAEWLESLDEDITLKEQK